VWFSFSTECTVPQVSAYSVTGLTRATASESERGSVEDGRIKRGLVLLALVSPSRDTEHACDIDS